jgi:hypothetical protein
MSKYTMKDVNKLMAERGWRKNQAMSYFIEIGAKTGDGTSQNLINTHRRATKKSK